MFLWACGPGFFWKCFFSPSGRCSFLGLRPGPFFEMVLFALRALFSLGLRPGLFCPPGVLPPAGNFLLAQKVPQKRLPPVALRGFSHHFRPPPVLPSICLHRGGPGWRSAEARNASTVPFVATSENMPHPQPSRGHSKQPRKIPFTRNPLGAFLTCLHQRGSRNTVQNMEGVSTAFCIQPRVFDTRLSNTRMPTSHYLMSIHKLTESKAKLTLQRHYIAAC